MLSTISLLTTYLVAAIYPLSFWVSFRDPLRQGFHRFHTGLPCFLAGVIMVYIFVRPFPGHIQMLSLLWTASLFAVTFFYWHKEFPQPMIVSLPACLGLIAYYYLHTYLLGPDMASFFVSILGGLILCSTLFAMNLGHWYLNVHGLPVSHLVRCTQFLGIFILIRFFWDLLRLFTTETLHRGISIPLYRFVLTLDGFLLALGFVFGLIFPLASLWYVLGTLRLKNTQSATGILYVSLCSVLIGNLTYTYYLVKFGIAL